MKKRICLLIGIFVLALVAGCGKSEAADVSPQSDKEVVTKEDKEIQEEVEKEEDTEEETEEATSEETVEKYTFTDALDREVTIENPQRVVTLLGSFCDEWLLAGGSVVGTVSDTFKNYDFGFDESVVDIGSHMEPNAEMIISLNPDFVIASSMLDSQVELLNTLEDAGITVAYFNINSFDDYLDSLNILTDITGEKEFYDEYGTEVQTQIENAKAQIDGRKPTVLFVRAAATSVKVKGSEGTVGGEILADLDTINIADSESLLEDLSMEAIISADPDYIFVTTQGSDTEAALANVDELMISNPAWNSLKAVQNDNYYVIDKALYNSKPNARWGEAYQLLADIIYPKE